MFDQVISEAASRFNLSATSASSLVRGILSLLLDERTGGPQGFVDLFRRVGLGDAITSSFGGRQGTPVTAADIESAVGTGAVDALASASGVPRAIASAALAFLLPKLLSQLTPGGTLPSATALLSQVSAFLHPSPAIAATARLRAASRRNRRWVPWAAAALLAVTALLWLRPPGGTIDPQLSLSNRDGKVAYSGIVRDESTKTMILTALRSTFGAPNISGDLRVDPHVKTAGWIPRLDDLLRSAKHPGLDLALNGNSVGVGGWIGPSDRQAVAGSIRNILGSRAAIVSTGNAPPEAVRAANDRALSALKAIGTSGTTSSSVVDAMNLAVINFATGSAAIPAESMDVIRQSANAIAHAPRGVRIEIGGHTDATGDPVSNLTLSQARADAVKQALVDAGVASSVLTTRGYGNNRPRATNDTEYGRFQNRRIEYTVIE